MALRASNAQAFRAREVTKGICLLYSFWIFLVSFLTSDETEIDKEQILLLVRSPKPEGDPIEIRVDYLSISVKHIMRIYCRNITQY